MIQGMEEADGLILRSSSGSWVAINTPTAVALANSVVDIPLTRISRVSRRLQLRRPASVRGYLPGG